MFLSNVINMNTSWPSNMSGISSDFTPILGIKCHISQSIWPDMKKNEKSSLRSMYDEATKWKSCHNRTTSLSKARSGMVKKWPKIANFHVFLRKNPNISAISRPIGKTMTCASTSHSYLFVCQFWTWSECPFPKISVRTQCPHKPGLS